MTDAIICAPMRIEARAIRRGLRANSDQHSSDPPEVLRTGYGTTRAADRAGELKATSFGQLVVMGVGGGLVTDLAPGDLVVGTEVGVATCLSAPLLALLAAGERENPATERGIRWLARTQRPDGTWDEPWFTGTGFPGDFYINYHLYRLVFPISALGRYAGGTR